MFKAEGVKKDFPIFENYKATKGRDLIYLDSAASSQTPKQVVSAMDEYYFGYRSNVHRSPYDLGEKATSDYEGAREIVAKFIGAETNEIIFTSGATNSINMLVGMLEKFLSLKSGDEIVATVSEHHSNIIPFQELAKRTGATLKTIPLSGTDLDYEVAESLITEKTKLISLPVASNVLGTIYDTDRIIKKVHSVGALVILDGAKATGHINIDVKKLDCDFLFFSAHKMLGPTGTGVLYGKYEHLEKLYPVSYGGGIVEKVSELESEYNKVPTRFEAGTPNIAGVIGLASAIKYLENIGLAEIEKHSQDLVKYAIEKLSEVEGVKIVSEKNVEKNVGIVSFNIEGIHPHDVAEVLGRESIAIRGGHHCAMPLMKTLEVSGVCRVSFYIYNDKSDVDALVSGLEKVKELLGK